MKPRYYESDIADEIFDALFLNITLQQLDFVRDFPHAELNREFAHINLNNEFVIKVERI